MPLGLDVVAATESTAITVASAVSSSLYPSGSMPSGTVAVRRESDRHDDGSDYDARPGQDRR